MAKRIANTWSGVVVDDEVDEALAEAASIASESPRHLVAGSGRSDLAMQGWKPSTFTESSPLAGGHHRAVDAHPVAEVEGVEGVVLLLPQHAAGHDELHRAGLARARRMRR